MKRIFIILYYIAVLVGSSILFWNKEYTHHYYGDGVRGISINTYTYGNTGEVSSKSYWFTYTNKSGQTRKVNDFDVMYNIEWFETELRNGKYYDPEIKGILLAIFVVSIINLFFIILQYAFYWGGGSDSPDHCERCPLQPVCPCCQAFQNAIINDDIVFLKFYKWFGSNFIKFWGY